MKKPSPSYQCYRFLVRLYRRFWLSFRVVEELLAERGIAVTYETVRQWCRKFGPAYARIFKKHQGLLVDTWHITVCVYEVMISRGECAPIWSQQVR